MHVPVEIQIWRICVFSLVGIGANVVFHSYRAYRSVFNPGTFWRHFLDVIVALVTLGVAGAVTFVVNWGEIRVYVPVSLAFGYIASNTLIGNAVYESCRKGYLKIRSGMRWTRAKLVDPPKRAACRTYWSIRQELAKLDEPPYDPPGGPLEPPPDQADDSNGKPPAGPLDGPRS